MFSSLFSTYDWEGKKSCLNNKWEVYCVTYIHKTTVKSVIRYLKIIQLNSA